MSNQLPKLPDEIWLTHHKDAKCWTDGFWIDKIGLVTFASKWLSMKMLETNYKIYRLNLKTMELTEEEW